MHSIIQSSRLVLRQNVRSTRIHSKVCLICWRASSVVVHSRFRSPSDLLSAPTQQRRGMGKSSTAVLLWFHSISFAKLPTIRLRFFVPAITRFRKNLTKCQSRVREKSSSEQSRIKSSNQFISSRNSTPVLTIPSFPTLPRFWLRAL